MLYRAEANRSVELSDVMLNESVSGEFRIRVPRIRDIMGGSVETLPTEAYAIEVIKKMFDKKIGSISIVEGEKLVGIITERDLVYKLYIRGDNPVQVKVTEIMTKDPVGISPDESVLNAAALMQNRGFRRLPVVENGRLVGFINQSDLLKAMLSGISTL